MDNKIIDLINAVKMSNNSVLDLSGLNLSFIPEEVFSLNFLTELDLSNNKIEEIPVQIRVLENLKKLTLENNPIKNIPFEIIKSGVDSIKRYLQEVHSAGSTSQLMEAKLLLVGEGGVGKTTLMRKLIDKSAPLPGENETTRGIDISRLQFNAGSNHKITINIWDFGGQEIYYGTHQFFLTQNSLYALVIDSRREDHNLNYWLNIIELLGDNSPLIIIVNEKHDRSVNFDEAGIKNRFANVVRILKSNFLTERGLNEISHEIRHQIQMLSHIGIHLPELWMKIRKQLEELSIRKSYITIERYFEICNNYNLSDRSAALLLSHYFHDIGILFHFQNNPLLKRIIILNPEWLTTAIYKIFENYEIRMQNGEFNKKIISQILDETEYLNVEDEILEIMSVFEFCYKIDEDTFIIPQLLPFEGPIINWDSKATLTVKYVYTFMPKGILNRLIVRMHHYISENTVWNSGVVLSRNDSLALVIQEYWKNEITVSVKGIDSRDLLTIILENIDTINTSFKSNLQAQKMVPCLCNYCLENSKPHFYDFGNLKRRFEFAKEYIECENSYENVSVKKLLGFYEKPSIEENEILNITLKKLGIDVKLLEEGGVDEK